jgi:hypothetical protein
MRDLIFKQFCLFLRICNIVIRLVKVLATVKTTFMCIKHQNLCKAILPANPQGEAGHSLATLGNLGEPPLKEEEGRLETGKTPWGG